MLFGSERARVRNRKNNNSSNNIKLREVHDLGYLFNIVRWATTDVLKKIKFHVLHTIPANKKQFTDAHKMAVRCVEAFVTQHSAYTSYEVCAPSLSASYRQPLT